VRARERGALRRPFQRRTPGDDLLSQEVYLQVPSARAGLTAVFGMGTGMTPPPWPPGELLVLNISVALRPGENSIASTNVLVKSAIKPSAD
jgi:hypothetical protein